MGLETMLDVNLVGVQMEYNNYVWMETWVEISSSSRVRHSKERSYVWGLPWVLYSRLRPLSYAACLMRWLTALKHSSLVLPINHVLRILFQAEILGLLQASSPVWLPNDLEPMMSMHYIKRPSYER